VQGAGGGRGPPIIFSLCCHDLNFRTSIFKSAGKGGKGFQPPPPPPPSPVSLRRSLEIRESRHL
jgi:hypothetical protein